MGIVVPGLPVEPRVELTDDLRRLALAEIRDACAPSTFDAAMRSLRARKKYPIDVSEFITSDPRES